jgi:hypothetical protein
MGGRWSAGEVPDMDSILEDRSFTIESLVAGNPMMPGLQVPVPPTSKPLVQNEGIDGEEGGGEDEDEGPDVWVESTESSDSTFDERDELEPEIATAESPDVVVESEGYVESEVNRSESEIESVESPDSTLDEREELEPEINRSESEIEPVESPDSTLDEREELEPEINRSEAEDLLEEKDETDSEINRSESEYVVVENDEAPESDVEPAESSDGSFEEGEDE